MHPLLIGIKGTVLALDAETGQEIWRTDLKGIGFVNIMRSGDRVLAATRGEVFCLDSSSGDILWHNPLKGLGQGLVTFATEQGAMATAVLAQQLQQEAAATAAAASGAAAGCG
jgi:outer membrane protein assembly factor BamB